MAFPIRFKLICKETGEQLKGSRTTALLLPSGQPAKMVNDFYSYVSPLSTSEFELWVALEKNESGHWVYFKVGN